MDVIVKFKSAEKEAILPVKATTGSAGLDLFASESGEIAPGDRKMVSTGLIMELPNGFEGQIRPRSGLAAKHGVTVLNSPGTVDSDYRGVVKVILINLGKEQFSFKEGDRIAQLVVAPIPNAVPVVTTAISDTTRGTGGFGSSGR
ncbi:dUTP diphosphatase [bacterium]|nr:dUTP diphosphatase [bacterium]NDD55902.1 dUTP diphosphatase [bacterium]